MKLLNIKLVRIQRLYRIINILILYIYLLTIKTKEQIVIYNYYNNSVNIIIYIKNFIYSILIYLD